MLKSLEIKNFRSIVDASLELGKVNLFIGPNGGGKSNILEAIGILSAALGRSIEPIDLDLKGVRLSLPRLFKATFKNRNIPKGFSLTAETASVRYTTHITAGDRSSSLQFSHEGLWEGTRKIMGRAPRGNKIHIEKPSLSGLERAELPGETRGIFDAYRNFADLSEEAQQELDHLASYVIYAPQTAILRGTAIDSRNVEPLGLTGGRLASAVSELLSHLRRRSDTAESGRISECLSIVWRAKWPESISVGQPRPTVVPPQVPTVPRVLYFKDRFLHTARSQLSAFDASEGTLYLLFVATLLGHPKAPKIFALDNVDGTLNPGLVFQLVNHIADIVSSNGHSDRQVFLTSHNPTSIDAIDLFDDESRVFVVRRNEKTGHTEFTRVQPPPGMDRNTWLEYSKGRNTSALWLEGFIEGALNKS